MIKVKSLSYSTVNQYVNCSQRVYWEKIEHLPKRQRMTSKQKFGIAIHSAVAAFLRSMVNRVCLDLEQLVRVFKIRYESLAPNNVVDNEQKTTSLCCEARVLLKLFLAAKLPANIISIEHPFKYALTSTLDCVGQMDLLARDDSGVLNVIDFKSTSKMPAGDQIHKYEEQCLVYGMGLKEPVKPKIWLFLRRKKKPTFEVLDLDIDNIEYDEVIQKFTNVAKAISAGIHFRNRSWQCGSCPYNYLCYREPKEVERSYKEAA